MPIKVPNNLPAVDTLTKENVFVMTDARAMTQDIRPLHILLLNLMPTKIETETQLTRLLGNTPLQIELELLQTSTHKAHNVSQEHMLAFYKTFHEIRNNYYDGMIITGAPVELMEFEEVEYWDELCEIMEWSKSHVHSTFHICWGAQAALYYHYGIPKHVLPKKLSGVYEHHLDYKNGMLFRGFDDVFYVPHSRNTTVNREDIEAVSELKVIASSPEAGVFAVKSENDRQIFVMGHSEYDWDTLLNEYLRDKKAGLEPAVPDHYFPEDDDTQPPVVRWRSCANLLYSNWLNYFVYQSTPYDISTISREDLAPALQERADLKVAKFGGTSLATAAQFRKVAEILREDPARRYIVVSAPGKRRKDDAVMRAINKALSVILSICILVGAAAFVSAEITGGNVTVLPGSAPSKTGGTTDGQQTALSAENRDLTVTSTSDTVSAITKTDADTDSAGENTSDTSVGKNQTKNSAENAPVINSGISAQSPMPIYSGSENTSPEPTPVRAYSRDINAEFNGEDASEPFKHTYSDSFFSSADSASYILTAKTRGAIVCEIKHEKLSAGAYKMCLYMKYSPNGDGKSEAWRLINELETTAAGGMFKSAEIGAAAGTYRGLASGGECRARVGRAARLSIVIVARRLRRSGEIACGSDGCGAAAMGVGNPISCKTERYQDLQESLRCERRNHGICRKKTGETTNFFLQKCRKSEFARKASCKQELY